VRPVQNKEKCVEPLIINPVGINNTIVIDNGCRVPGVSFFLFFSTRGFCDFPLSFFFSDNNLLAEHRRGSTV
jgi:hypothetical protein